MTYQLWPYITFEEAKWVNITNTTQDFNGVNGYPVIDGALFLSDGTYYGFNPSHSLLLNLISKHQFEIMVIWNS